MLYLFLFVCVISQILAIPQLRYFPQLNVRVVGGHDVDISSSPWQVALLTENNFRCGGVLISQSWVLTAANCIRYAATDQISINAGSTSWKSGGQVVKVKRSVYYLETNEVNPEHNIVLLELVAPVTINSAKPAQLAPSTMELTVRTPITVTGWGRINASAFFYPTHLQAIQIPIVDQQVCQDQHTNYSVTFNMFCAGTTEGKSPCYGDDGGPASIANVVIGITNGRGINCALSSAPSIFMRISSYRDWIKAVTDV